LKDEVASRAAFGVWPGDIAKRSYAMRISANFVLLLDFGVGTQSLACPRAVADEFAAGLAGEVGCEAIKDDDVAHGVNFST
jgi:hypothetical protein